MFSADIASCPSADTGQRLKMSEKSPRQPSVGDAEDRRRGARDQTIKLRRSLERISIDVLRIKVLDLADCLPLQASSWRDQEWQRWKGQVLRAFDVVPLAAAISTMSAMPSCSSASSANRPAREFAIFCTFRTHFGHSNPSQPLPGFRELIISDVPSNATHTCSLVIPRSRHCFETFQKLILHGVMLRHPFAVRVPTSTHRLTPVNFHCE